MKTIQEKISETLLQARNKKGYSQLVMASKMGTSKQTIGNWEKGRTLIGPDDFALYFKLTNQNIQPALQYIFDIELDTDTKLYNLIQNMEKERKEALIEYLLLTERSINEK